MRCLLIQYANTKTWIPKTAYLRDKDPPELNDLSAREPEIRYGAGLFFILTGLLKKKKKWGRFSIWNLQGYRRNSVKNAQGLIKIKLESLVAIKKKPCGIFIGLGFWSLNLQEVEKVFWNFSGWGFAVLYLG